MREDSRCLPSQPRILPQEPPDARPARRRRVVRLFATAKMPQSQRHQGRIPPNRQKCLLFFFLPATMMASINN
jgi:hypothetical protein